MPFEEDRLVVLVALAALLLVFLVATDIVPRVRYRRERDRAARGDRELGARGPLVVPASEPPPISVAKARVEAPPPAPPKAAREVPNAGVTVLPWEADGTLLMRQYPAWTLSRDRHLVLEESEEGVLCHFLAGYPVEVGDELEVELVNGAWLRGRYEWGGRPGEAPRLIAWVRHPRSHPTIESTGYALLLDTAVQLRWTEARANAPVKRIQYARLP